MPAEILKLERDDAASVVSVGNATYSNTNNSARRMIVERYRSQFSRQNLSCTMVRAPELSCHWATCLTPHLGASWAESPRLRPSRQSVFLDRETRARCIIWKSGLPPDAIFSPAGFALSYVLYVDCIYEKAENTFDPATQLPSFGIEVTQGMTRKFRQ